MKNGRIDIGRIRREQIIDAATSVITEHGIQELSLSAIEKKARMSRGQLTYYYRTKEDILLAVFDRVVQRMHEQVEDGPCQLQGFWDHFAFLLERLLTQPPMNPEFGCLQYTFLSQMAHRDDFRQRLATLYNTWRTHMAGGLTYEKAGRRGSKVVTPRNLATLFQAIIHGLMIQRAADPESFDGREMLELTLDVVGNYLGKPKSSARKKRPAASRATRKP